MNTSPEPRRGSGWQWSPSDTDRYAGKKEDDVLGQDVATAPGDLPIKMVVERARAKRRQFRHDNTIEPQSPAPGQPVEIVACSGEEMPVLGACVYYTVDGSKPTAGSASVEMRLSSREWDVLSGYLAIWITSIPGQAAGTTVRYRIGGWVSEPTVHRDESEPLTQSDDPELWAQDGQGFWFRFEPDAGVSTFAYSAEDQHPKAPDWVRDGIIYHIFLDRFRTSGPSDEFHDTGFKGIHGGTIEGVRRSMPYIDQLGATAIWLSPLHPAETYHRYDGMDFNAVDPVLGTLDDVKRLTAEGSNRGLRFLMDFVPSHLSWHHPAFLDAQRDRTSPSASWFTFYQHPDRYRTFLDLAPFLPSINTDDPGARQHLIDAAVRWLSDFGIDGFRLDHAIGPSMDFWVAFREATKHAKPDSFTVGEATDTPDSLRRFAQRLDAILDFPLARALRSTFALGSWDVAQLDRFLNAYEAFMETGPFRVSFLDNHDMDRFLFVAGGDTNRLKLAALCQFALEPTPAIYYGTEIALHQDAASSDQSAGGDSQVRHDMMWDESLWNTDVLDFYRRLTHARREAPALRRGARRTIHLDAEAGTYAFIREAPFNGSAPAIAAFNLSDELRTIDISDLPAGAFRVLVSTTGLSNEAGPAAISLAPRSAAICVGENR